MATGHLSRKEGPLTGPSMGSGTERRVNAASQEGRANICFVLKSSHFASGFTQEEIFNCLTQKSDRRGDMSRGNSSGRGQYLATRAEDPDRNPA